MKRVVHTGNGLLAFLISALLLLVIQAAEYLPGKSCTIFTAV